MITQKSSKEAHVKVDLLTLLTVNVQEDLRVEIISRLRFSVAFTYTFSLLFQSIPPTKN